MKKNLIKKTVKCIKEKYKFITYNNFITIFKNLNLKFLNIYLYYLNKYNIKIIEELECENFKENFIEDYYIKKFSVDKFLNNFNNKKKINYKKNYININLLIKKLIKKLFKKKLFKCLIINLKKKYINKFLNNFNLFNFKLNINSKEFKKNLIKILINYGNKNNYKVIFENIKLKGNNINLIQKIYNLFKKIYDKIKSIKLKLYDILFNLSYISILKFNIYFTNYSSNLKWIISISNLKNFDNKFIKNYKNFIKNYENKLKIIEKKLKINIKNFIIFFEYFVNNKNKIDLLKNKIIKYNTNKVFRYCKKYYKSDLYLDYIQEGNLGLIKAVNNYDYKCDIKFNIYLTMNIKYNISKYLYKGNKIISVPNYVLKKIYKINNFIKKNKTFDLKKIAKKTFIKKKLLFKILNIKNNNNYSLDKNLDENTKFSDIMKSEEKEIEEILIERDIKKKFNNNLKKLNNKELNVIKLRLNDNKNKIFTLSEIGKKLNLSKERIRQIQNNAILKLKKIYKNNGLI